MKNEILKQIIILALSLAAFFTAVFLGNLVSLETGESVTFTIERK